MKITIGERVYRTLFEDYIRGQMALLVRTKYTSYWYVTTVVHSFKLPERVFQFKMSGKDALDNVALYHGVGEKNTYFFDNSQQGSDMFSYFSNEDVKCPYELLWRSNVKNVKYRKIKPT